MMPRPTRKFTLTDAMILIAATAVGLAGVRAEGMDHYHHNSLYILYRGGADTFDLLNRPGPPPNWYPKALEAAREAGKAVPVVAALTMALLVLRLRRPRPPLRLLSRQPGLVAEGAATATLAVNLVLGSLQLLLAALGQSTMYNPHYFANAGFLACQALQAGPAGMAVLASWTILALGGRWRREPGWIDRAGLGIGVAWIALMLCDWAVDRLH